MKLLIFTQKVDSNDTVLGFFHRWIIELAKHYELVTVVCLYEAAHQLPANVKVLSLGKEKRISRGYYLKHFYEYILKYRAEYDSVFVHMNQEYVLLGGIFWKLFGKKVYMWRNHYAGSYLTDMAAFFCTKVFCTSKYSFTAKYSKAVLMPVGIDTESFCLQRNVSRRPQSILSLGRIAPSKNLDQLIEALGILKKENIDFDASIVGDALPQDGGYLESLKNRAGELGMEGQVIFKPGVPNDQTPSIYSAHEIRPSLKPWPAVPWRFPVIWIWQDGLTLIIYSRKITWMNYRSRLPTYWHYLPKNVPRAQLQPEDLSRRTTDCSS
jgi:glycosyltransferase involved in cell wall biosynthesis